MISYAASKEERQVAFQISIGGCSSKGKWPNGCVRPTSLAEQRTVRFSETSCLLSMCQKNLSAPKMRTAYSTDKITASTLGSIEPRNPGFQSNTFTCTHMEMKSEQVQKTHD
ncbi:unnamed protein product [Caretta caretta]